jgi:hypothetical protein
MGTQATAYQWGPPLTHYSWSVRRGEGHRRLRVPRPLRYERCAACLLAGPGSDAARRNDKKLRAPNPARWKIVGGTIHTAASPLPYRSSRQGPGVL